MLNKIKLELEQLAAKGLLRQLKPVQSRKDGCVEVRGKQLIDFTNWDYLALNSNRDFLTSLQREIESLGVGACAARTASGTHQRHVACEYRIAQFLNTQSSILFSSKNQAVLSLVTSLVAEGDLVFLDETMHSPVSDAAYLVNAQAIYYHAGSLAQLKSELSKCKPTLRKFIFAESISPVTGIGTDLGYLVELARTFKAQLIVDESYALAALGLRGAGGREPARARA